jgi:three-Cys-motif partner protein
VAVPETTIWKRDPHTEAKHHVLGRYYDAWYPIMLNHWPQLTVFEGYAGPGEYLNGEEGSPIIALGRLLGRPEVNPAEKPVRYIFVEARDDRLEHLRSVVAASFPNLPSHVTIDFVPGSCEAVWDTALANAEAWGQPIFANLDPFGPGVPYTLVQRLGRNPGSEVLVTFASDWLRRFASLEDVDDGDRQFGSREWRKVTALDSAAEKELFLLSAYRETLKRAGFGLSAPFKLSDEGGRSFFLIFGTGHRRGLEVMKEAMWRTDPVGGIRFRDPSDPDQGILDFGVPEPDLTPLVHRLRALLTAQAPQELTVEELRDFALFKTAFRAPHATTAVRRMLHAGELRRSPEHGQLSRKVRVRLP